MTSNSPKTAIAQFAKAGQSLSADASHRPIRRDTYVNVAQQ